jgi:ribonuclease J
MSALYRMAFGEHDKVKLTERDLVVLSSHPIPGNEKLVGKIVNALTKRGVGIYHTGTSDVHVSGHACQEELKLMLALLHPKYFMPVHGESRHLAAHRNLALQMGIPSPNIIISEIGKVLEITKAGATFNGVVPSGQLLIDGSGMGDVGSAVLRERRHLAEDGMVALSVCVDMHGGYLLTEPEIVTKGFSFHKDEKELLEGAKQVVIRTIDKGLRARRINIPAIQNALQEELRKYFWRQTKRRPMIVPMILET